MTLLQRFAHPLQALSVLFALTGAGLFALTAFHPALALDRRQIVSVLVLECALVYAFAVTFRQDTGPHHKEFPKVTEAMTDGQRQAAAIDYCESSIGMYHRVYRYNFQLWRFLLTSSIVLGTLGTVLSGIPTSSRTLLVLRTLAVAVTTIATGLNSSYRFQQESVRQGAAADALRGELVKYAAGSKPYDEAKSATASFAANVRGIIAVENQTWVASLQAKEPGLNTAA